MDLCVVPKSSAYICFLKEKRTSLIMAFFSHIPVHYFSVVGSGVPSHFQNNSKGYLNFIQQGILIAPCWWLLKSGNFSLFFGSICICHPRQFLYNSRNSCIAVKCVCPIFSLFCTEYVVCGTSLPFTVSCVQLPLKTERLLLLPHSSHSTVLLPPLPPLLSSNISHISSICVLLANAMLQSKIFSKLIAHV